MDVGAVSLLALTALSAFALRLDGPIQAPGLLPALLAKHNIDGLPGTVGRLDEPCALRLLRGADGLKEDSFAGALYAVCALEGGAAWGLRLDRPVDATIRPALKLPGVLRVGGPLAAEQGVLLYEPSPGVFRFTTSNRTARRLARSHAAGGGPERAWLVFGHAGWLPGQLEREVAQGAWTDVDLWELPPP